MIKEGTIITLEDNKNYTVVFKTTYKSEEYVYLIDQADYTNTMFCSINGKSLNEIFDQKIILELLKLYALSKKNI